MPDCVFCQIVTNNTPCYKIYEDDHVLAFLDRRMINDGHTMIIPKDHIDHFTALPDDLAAHIVKIGNKIGRKIEATLKPKRVGFVVSGFGVAHAHYHVIPLWDENDITSIKYVVPNSNPVAFGIQHIPIPNDDEKQRIANLIKIESASDA